MLLQQWDSYLVKNGLLTNQPYTPISNFTDYISVPSLFDLLNTIYTIHTIDEYVIYSNIINSTQTILNTNYNHPFYYTTIQTNPFKLTNELHKSSLYDINSEIISVLINLTSVKTDLESLILVFPEQVIHLENFESSILDLDEISYEILSAPDSKIYYPII